ncbi:nucleolar complex protein [Anaeramoeba ignava]|uniref:Nucleolar complex protein n=1 Tax=Anaeramoeba ignava TaxID=1746090 RepID=A0A9Q0LIQ0_ANAIG|nr:nucleolar complex protein [Anaeramoeba ignava]
MSLSVKQINNIFQEIISNKKNINKITLLFDSIQDQKSEDLIIFTSINKLKKIFENFFKTQELNTNQKLFKNKEETPQIIFEKWLYEKFKLYLETLLDLLQNPQPRIQVPSLKYLMFFIKIEAQQNNEFNLKLFVNLIKRMLFSPNLSELVIEEFKNYVNFDDIKLYTMKSLNSIIQNEISKDSKKANFVLNAFPLIETIPVPEEEVNSFYAEIPQQPNITSTTFHKKEYNKMWLNYLKLDIPNTILKQILKEMDTKIIPHLRDPILITDFLMKCYDKSGIISILALKGIFVLMTEHGIEFPQFYTKLYAILQHDIFYQDEVSEFWVLLDVFLSSLIMPSYLAAAFAKRLARITLDAPPSGCLVAIPLIMNILIRYPSCRVLVDETLAIQEEKLSLIQTNDPYLFYEKNPEKSCALQSSLWEIKTLQKHYLPQVARLACSIEQISFDSSNLYNIIDLIDFSYKILFDSEISKKTKKDPSINFISQNQLFDPKNDSLKVMQMFSFEN